MTEHRFTDVQACVFDAYGTLFDFAAPLLRRDDRLGGQAERFGQLWRAKQLEYSWLRSLMGRYADFWHVTGDALDYAMASLGIDDPALRAELMQAYLDLDPYPDAAATLARCKAGGMKTAVLSNGSLSMLTAVVNRVDLGRHLDALLSVDARGIYKPHPSVYQLAVEALGIEAAHILFVSGNGWDAAGGATFGFQVAWINRGGVPTDLLPNRAAVEIPSLGALPPLLGL